MKSLIHVNDSERAEVYRNLVSKAGPAIESLSAFETVFAKMLASNLSDSNPNDFIEILTEVRKDAEVSSEIIEILAISEDKSRRLALPLSSDLAGSPLRSHASYTRSEALVGLGYASNPTSHVAGVAWCESTKTDALFVTLNKTDRAFSPTTMYRDYALNEKMFHWESQNSTRASSSTGQRYIHHADNHSNIVLFTRSTRADNGITSTYTCLGNVSYVNHVGERPMSITWELARPMPQQVYLEASTVAH
jgi:hypothetical protein